jgi:MraZ protein
MIAALPLLSIDAHKIPCYPITARSVSKWGRLAALLRGHGGICAASPTIFERGSRTQGSLVTRRSGVHEGEMDQFVSTFTNRIDTKGRVSVPASFRTVLAKDGLDGIYCYPSLDAPALDAGGQRLLNKINSFVEDLAPYSDERDQLATALFGTSEILSIDQDGRTTLPERLRDHAGITTHITFVGLGEKFQMWEPQRFESYQSEARQKVRNLRKLLGAGRRGSGGPEGARE